MEDYISGDADGERRAESAAVDRAAVMAEIRGVRDEFSRFMLSYKFGMDEITTKLRILQEEFRLVHAYNPIEHFTTRLKTPESLLAKVRRKRCEPTFERIRQEITDIAGVRVKCSFVSDTYRVFDMLTGQHDVNVVAVKDYIERPKPNGYRSLHAIVEVPVFLSDGATPVPVEVQFRTMAMDFWASLEHKIYYKFDEHVPDELLAKLRDAAATAARLDEDMEQIHREIHGDGELGVPEPSHAGFTVSDEIAARLLQHTAELRSS